MVFITFNSIFNSNSVAISVITCYPHLMPAICGEIHRFFTCASHVDTTEVVELDEEQM